MICENTRIFSIIKVLNGVVAKGGATVIADPIQTRKTKVVFKLSDKVKINLFLYFEQ